MRYSEYFIYNRLLSIMPIDFRTKFRNTCRIISIRNFKYNSNAPIYNGITIFSNVVLIL